MSAPLRVPRRRASRIARGAACALLASLGAWLGACAGFGASTTPRPVPRAPDAAGLERAILADDSAAVRAVLERDIRRFQRLWRESWQASLIDRNRIFLNLAEVQADYAFRVRNANGERFEALLCNAGWLGAGALANARATLSGAAVRTNLGEPRPTATERLAATAAVPAETFDFNNPFPGGVFGTVAGNNDERNLRVERRVRGALDKGQVCPRWIPADEGIPPDEGERLDLALPMNDRIRVVGARQALLQQLETAAAARAGDGWITGQLVRFLVDNGEFDQALVAAGSCTASTQLCSALLGYALEQRGDLAAATDAFRRARGAWDGASATCADTTTFALLPPEARRAAHGLPCDEARRLEARIWWLGDPLWSEPGNARFTAHHARLTTLQLRAATGEDERFSWRREGGSDARRETIIRYGWPTYTVWGGWQMDSALNLGRESVLMVPDAPYTTPEYAPDRVALVPAWQALSAPYRATPADWQVVAPAEQTLAAWWPAEHMALPAPLVPLAAGQRVLLRRDASLRLHLAIDSPLRGLDPDAAGPLRAWLIGSPIPDRFARIADTLLRPGEALRLTGDLPAEPLVLSLEVPGRTPTEVRHVRREGLEPPVDLSMMAAADVALSDLAFLLLPERGVDVPLDPDSALALLAGTLQVAADAPLALYWESYGFAPGDTLDVEVQVARRDETGALRQLGAALGLADAKRDSVSVRWREPDPGRTTRVLTTRVAAVSRAIALDLRNVAPGDYDVSVLMSRTDGTRAGAVRRITVVAAP